MGIQLKENLENKSPGPSGWGLCEGPATHPCETFQTKDSQRRNGTARFNGCRRKRVQRNMSNKLHIGTWNVQVIVFVKQEKQHLK